MESVAALTAVAGFLFVIFGIAIALYVLEVIALWKIFVKAGEDGWKAIIPFLNMYVLFKISWEVKFFWIWLACTVLGAIFTAATDSDFLPAIGSLLSLGAYVFTIIMYYYFTKSFGQSAAYTVGFVFLRLIFLLIFAFAGFEYIGNGYDISQAEKAGTTSSTTTYTASAPVDATPVDSTVVESSAKTSVESVTETTPENDPMGPSDSNL